MGLDRLGTDKLWRECDDNDRELYNRKAREYGCKDLDLMGHGMEMLGVPSGEGVEAAIGFYLLGKIGRMMSAWGRGTSPSDDTLNDTVVYAKMLRMARFEKREEDNDAIHRNDAHS